MGTATGDGNGEPRSGARFRALALWVAVGVALAAAQLYYWLSPHLAGPTDLAASLAVPLSALLVVGAWSRWSGSGAGDVGWFLPHRWREGLLLAGLFSLVYTLVLLEPGVAFGYSSAARPGPLDVLYWVPYAPLAAIAGEALYRGLLFDRLLRPHRLPLALSASAAAFALSGTNLSALVGLEWTTLVRTILLTTVTAFSLGIVLGLYYYKSGRSLLGPVVLRSAILYGTAFLPIVANLPGWQFAFLLALLAQGAVLMLVVFLVAEPRVVARVYLGETPRSRANRFLLRAHRRRDLRRAALVIGVVIALLGATYVGSQAALGTRQPLLAIESGSMEPALRLGDLVLLEQVDAAQIRIGTIIAFTSECLPSPVIHRVVGITETTSGLEFTTRGDANPGPDGCTTPYAAVIGRVAVTVPWLGYAVVLPQVTLGLLALAFVAGLVFLPPSNPRFPSRRIRR